MKNNYQRKKLSEVCEIISGTTPKTNIKEYWNGDLNWITPAEISEKEEIIYETERKITLLGAESCSLRKMPVGTVLFSSRAPIGKVAIAGTEMYCNQGFKNFICSDEIYNKYLFYFLKNNKEYLNSLGRGATFKEVSKSIISQVEISLPNLDEQKAICAKLDNITKQISLKYDELKKYDELVKSQFIEMFENKNFEQVLLSEVIDYEQPTKYIVASENYKDEYKTPVLTAGKSFILGYTNETDGIYNGAVKPTLIFDDFTTDCKYVDFDFKVKSSAMKLLHLKNTNEQILYYFYAINKIGFKPESHQRHWISKFANFTIEKPPIELQNQFADFVKHIDKLKFTIKESIEKLNLCYQSLMKEYFE